MIIIQVMHKQEIMARMFREGKTYQEIGNTFGTSRQYIQQCLLKLGITKKDGGAVLRHKLRTSHKLQNRDRRYIRKYGFCYEMMVELKAIKAYRKFLTQRKSAKSRGIGWDLTFPQWWFAWQNSGHWNNRGTGSGYCMARKGDTGPYSIDNIYFCTISKNFSDSYKFNPVSQRTKWLEAMKKLANRKKCLHNGDVRE